MASFFKAPSTLNRKRLVAFRKFAPSAKRNQLDLVNK
jgi:hypothetical protein